MTRIDEAFPGLKRFPELVVALSEKNDGNISFHWSGAKEVITSRERFLGPLGLSLDDCVAMEMKNEDIVKVVSEGDKSKGMRSLEDAVTADALITRVPGVMIFLYTGDCLPIILYDSASNAVALAHGSRRSTDKKLALRTVTAMQDAFGSRPEDMAASIGPGARKESYKIKLEDLPQKDSPEWRPFLRPVDNGRMAVNIAGYTTAQLKEAGLRTKNIHVSSIDTITSPDLFSHYRSTGTGEPEARFATIVGIRNG